MSSLEIEVTLHGCKSVIHAQIGSSRSELLVILNKVNGRYRYHIIDFMGQLIQLNVIQYNIYLLKSVHEI